MWLEEYCISIWYISSVGCRSGSLHSSNNHKLPIICCCLINFKISWLWWTDKQSLSTLFFTVSVDYLMYYAPWCHWYLHKLCILPLYLHLPVLLDQICLHGAACAAVHWRAADQGKLIGVRETGEQGKSIGVNAITKSTERNQHCAPFS